VTELEVQRCEACGVALFPDRLRCPTCGGPPAQRVPAGPGRVEEQTQVRRAQGQGPGAVRLGSVRLDAGPVVIARLREDVGAGSPVRLEVTPEGVIWARAQG
jgi:uncharacterized protein